MENFQELIFMVFGLGFFLYVVNLATRDENARYERQLRELREFGYREQTKTKRRRFRKNRY